MKKAEHEVPCLIWCQRCEITSVCAEGEGAVQKSKTVLWGCEMPGEYPLFQMFCILLCSLSHKNNSWTSCIQSVELFETLSQGGAEESAEGRYPVQGVWAMGPQDGDQWAGSQGSGTNTVLTSDRLPGGLGLGVKYMVLGPDLQPVHWMTWKQLQE